MTKSALSQDTTEGESGRSGRLFVISGPSGVGKGTLVDALIARLPNAAKSVSATTRPPRPGEVDGVSYHFLQRDQFLESIAQNRFFEYAEYNHNYYGTPVESVTNQRAHGLDVILEIEVQGAQIVRELVPDSILIFIQPPSIAALEERLRSRGTDSQARIAERIAIACAEMERLPRYDYTVVNDDFETALDHLRSIFIAERCRIRVADAPQDGSE